MKPLLAAAALLLIASPSARAQPPRTISVALAARSEGQGGRDANGAALVDEVRRGLLAMSDVKLIPAEQATRTIWIIGGSSGSAVSASLMITERYDRETLMVLGIEDDDMAARMMSLQIVNDHQLFTGTDVGDVARRIVASVNTGILARLRALPPKE